MTLLNALRVALKTIQDRLGQAFAYKNNESVFAFQ